MKNLLFLTGWLAAAGLVTFGAYHGRIAASVEAGTWFGTLLAVSGVLAILMPSIVRIALPASGLAVCIGGVVFSLIPESATGFTLLAVTMPIGLLLALALLHQPGTSPLWRLAAAVLAGTWHAGSIHGLTVPPLVSPFALYPWAFPLIILAWCVSGIFDRLRAASRLRSSAT